MFFIDLKSNLKNKQIYKVKYYNAVVFETAISRRDMLGVKDMDIPKSFVTAHLGVLNVLRSMSQMIKERSANCVL